MVRAGQRPVLSQLFRISPVTANCRNRNELARTAPVDKVERRPRAAQNSPFVAACRLMICTICDDMILIVARLIGQTENGAPF